MTPSVLHEPMLQEPQEKPLNSGSVLWMCLLYFLLQKYSGSLSGLPSASHPMRTLLQTCFSLTKKERDVHQAVCQLIGSPPDHCFHIAQVWCLVVNDRKNTFQIKNENREHCFNTTSFPRYVLEDFCQFTYGKIYFRIT